MSVWSLHSVGAVVAAAGAVLGIGSASAQTLAYGDANTSRYPASIFEQVLAPEATPQQQPYESVVAEPPEAAAAVPAHLRRQVVAYQTREAPGTIIVDTPNTYLYYVLGGGQAIRYGIGVGREGFTWSGVHSIARKAEWPDWVPPPEMIARQPYLPRWMAGGETNPLGARAMYIGGTMYRIHGTNAPSSIGQNVSSGCIRMLNEDVIDLYERVKLGSKVVVLPAGARTTPVVAGRDRTPHATLDTRHRFSAIY
jgi:lipoprotein-anchoring transpeptidase ErfK/SrfK